MNRDPVQGQGRCGFIAKNGLGLLFASCCHYAEKSHDSSRARP